MYERSLIEAAQYLATQRQGVVPAKDVWDAVARKGREDHFEVPSLADFATMLEADKRFEFIPAKKDLDEVESALEVEGSAEEELVQLGFFTEDQVRLKRFQAPRPVGEDDEEIGSIRRKSIGATKPVGRTHPSQGTRSVLPTARRPREQKSGAQSKGGPKMRAKPRQRKTGARKK